MFTRRQFLKIASLSYASLAFAGPGSQNSSRKTLILIELRGGNDSLNSLIPIQSREYRRLRPNLAIPEKEALGLSDGLALHPKLKFLRQAFSDQKATAIMGLGYPQPNRSHFRSIEIVETGSNSQDDWTDGWCSRLIRAGIQGDVADGIVIRSPELGTLNGPTLKVLSLRGSDQLKKPGRGRLREVSLQNPALKHVLGVQNDLLQMSRELAGRVTPLPRDAFPKGRFGEDIKTTCEILGAQLNIPVIRLTLGGFDTHTSQLKRHERLMEELDLGLSALMEFLKSHGLDSKALIATYSEFGRRPRENQQGGTDHGTAASHFLLGQGIPPKLLGKMPSLEDLLEENLRHGITWRSYWQALAEASFGIRTRLFPEFEDAPLKLI